MKRVTIFLADDLYERLRLDALWTGSSLAEVIRSRLEWRSSSGKKRGPAADPLLRAAGICRGPELSKRIDRELYGI
jgi:hypothetical protein